MLGRIKQTDLTVPAAATAATATTRAPRRASSTRSTAARRAASTRPRRSLLDVNELAQGREVHSASARIRGQRRRQPARVFAPTPPASASTRCTSRTCAPARCSTEHRSEKVALGRLGRRQQDALLHDAEDAAKRSLPALSPRARRARERRARCTRRRTNSSASRCRRSRSKGYLFMDVGSLTASRSAVPARRPADRRVEDDRRAAKTTTSTTSTTATTCSTSAPTRTATNFALVTAPVAQSRRSELERASCRIAPT